MAGDDSEFMRIRVRKEHGKDIPFRVKKNILMIKVKEAYIKNISENERMHSTLFFYRRKLIGDCETPLTIGLADNDYITAVSDESGNHCQDSTGDTTDSEDDEKSQTKNDE